MPFSDTTTIPGSTPSIAAEAVGRDAVDHEMVALDPEVDAGLEPTHDDGTDPEREGDDRDAGREQVPALLAHGPTVAGAPDAAPPGFPATSTRDATAGSGRPAR